MVSKSSVLGLLRDVGVACIIMAIILGSLYAYAQNWPPMVVIESQSMMHGPDSRVGVIDTGDLVLVKKVTERSDIASYVEGQKEDYKMYGDYGDVIIYAKNGGTNTPVIHRAVVWLEANRTISGRDSFDIPRLDLWNQAGKVNIPNYGHKQMNLTIDLGIILQNFRKHSKEIHSGFVTKGDNNLLCDQTSLREDGSGGPLVEPVKVDWIVGKAVGELPWFGLIKLYVNGDLEGNSAPSASVRNLVIALILLIATPMVLDLVLGYFVVRREDEDGGREEGTRDEGRGTRKETEGAVDKINRFELPPYGARQSRVSKSELERRFHGGRQS